MMDVFEAIRTRRSIRKCRTEPIPNDRLEMIFEAARLAPSAGNRQPWRFVVVQDADRKRALAEAANNQSFLSEAAAIVAAVGDSEVSTRWHEKDTMTAVEHMVLAANDFRLWHLLDRGLRRRRGKASAQDSCKNASYRIATDRHT